MLNSIFPMKVHAICFVETCLVYFLCVFEYVEMLFIFPHHVMENIHNTSGNIHSSACCAFVTKFPYLTVIASYLGHDNNYN